MKTHIIRLIAETGVALENILKAEDFLHNAGIHFDTGYDIEKGVRNWFIDFETEKIVVCEIDD